MHFSKSDDINGVPVTTARGIARYLYPRAETLEAIASFFDREPDSALADMVALRSAGFVDVSLHRDEEHWLLTESGFALSKATFARPIKRSTAERLLAGVVERAAEYNRTPGHLLTVDRLRVFGSYLDPAVDHLGDLDIEVTASPEVLDAQAAKAYADASGRQFADYLEHADWPRIELRRLLRGGSKSIDLQDARRGELSTEMVVVYERSADARAQERPA